MSSITPVIIPLPWFTLYGQPDKAGKLARFKCAVAMLIHETVELIAGSAIAHSMNAAIRYNIGAPLPPITLSFETISSTDLRDSDGNQMIIAKITELAGTYETGGIVIRPEDLGFSQIQYMSIQSNVSIRGEDFGGDPGDPWVLLLVTSLMRMVEDGEIVWRWIFHMTSDWDGEGPMDVLDEYPAGITLVMSPDYSPVIMAIGS